MNSIVVFAAFVGITTTLAAPQFPAYPAYPVLPAAPAPLYKTENIQVPGLSKAEARDDFGQYSLSYVTANGIHVTERSFLKLGHHGDYIPVREGTYSYTSPEGVPVSYGYVADENGFVVKGSPLPIAPQPIV